MAREPKRAPSSAPEDDRAPSQQATAPETQTVPMVRDPGQFPPPHKADVHPKEVANYAAAGWQFA